MRRVVGLLVALTALGGIGGCTTATGQREKLIEALSLQKPGDRDTYVVKGDPFCEVKGDLLDTKKLVQDAKAQKKLKRLLVTNPAESVGVVGVAPFGGSCKKQVVAGVQTIK